MPQKTPSEMLGGKALTLTRNQSSTSHGMAYIPKKLNGGIKRISSVRFGKALPLQQNYKSSHNVKTRDQIQKELQSKYMTSEIKPAMSNNDQQQGEILHSA